MSFIIVVGVLWCSWSVAGMWAVEIFRFRAESLDLSGEEALAAVEEGGCWKCDSVVFEDGWVEDGPLGGDDWDEVFIIY